MPQAVASTPIGAPAPVSVGTDGKPVSQTGETPVPTTITTTPGANANAALQTPGTMGGSTTPPLLTTSAQSRSTTASNVGTLNTAITNTAAGNAASSSTGGAGPNADPSKAGTAGYDVYGNSTGTGGSDIQAARVSSGTYLGQDGNQYYNYDSTPVIAAAGGVSSSGSGGTGGDDEDEITSAVSGLPQSLQALAASNLTQLSQQQSQAKSILAQAQATLSNDPAATAAVNAIAAKYDILITAMQQKNTQVLGKASSEVGAFGGLGAMNTNFMSDEMDAASQRISTLVSEQQSAMLTAQSAYAKQDLAAFNTAMDNYNKTITDMNTALNDLNTATDKQVTQAQAQAKIDAAAQKQGVATDISKATNLGTAIAQNLANAGITDPDQQAAYIASMATEYGISDSAILQSAVVKAQQAQQKLTTSTANTDSEIAKRNAAPATGAAKGGTDANYAYTSADVTAAQNVLQNGGSGYAAAGSDGYSDPGAYVALMNSWINLGGTAAGFAKVFPPKKYVNPASYSELPASIAPKAPAASGGAGPSLNPSTPTLK